MEIPLTEIKAIAKLCRIRLSEKEANALQGDLRNIFGYFSDLEALDTGNIEPTGWTVQNQSVLREDVASFSMPKAEILANAPDTDESFIKIRRVLN